MSNIHVIGYEAKELILTVHVLPGPAAKPRAKRAKTRSAKKTTKTARKATKSPKKSTKKNAIKKKARKS